MTTPRESFEPYFTAFAEEAEEDIFDTDTVYLFTWSPDPARYPTNKPSEQYKILLDLVLIHSYKCFKTYAFSPEMNDNGNIHIHGWYVIKDAVKYFKWFLPKCKSFGFVRINKMKNKSALAEYYKKDIEVMQDVCDPYPVPLTHYNNECYRKFSTSKKRLRLVPITRHFCDITKYLNKK